MTFADQTVREFTENVASGTATPGGGAATAVCGAAGAALCAMVCNLTVGNDDYAGVETELTELRDELASRRVRLLALADEDSSAVRELLASFAGPEDEDRADAIQDASKRATEVPLATAEACLDVVERAAVVTGKGNQHAVADAGIGAFLAHSALTASLFTVRVNLPAIEDAAFVGEVEGRSSEIAQAGEEAFGRVRSNFDDAV